MGELFPIKCRNCGEINMVERESTDFVRMAVPVDMYDAVIRLLHNAKHEHKARRTSIPEADLKRAQQMFYIEGKQYREIAAEMGWSLSSTYRRIQLRDAQKGE